MQRQRPSLPRLRSRCYSCELLQTELKETLNLSLKSMWSILASRVLLLRIRLREAPLTDTVWRETAIQFILNLHKKDHTFHANLQIVSLIIKIKITGSGLLVIIRCSCYLDFLPWGLSLSPGVKHSSYHVNSRHHFNLCYILASDQLFGSSAKKA